MGERFRHPLEQAGIGRAGETEQGAHSTEVAVSPEVAFAGKVRMHAGVATAAA
jgi:hypothetical protein